MCYSVRRSSDLEARLISIDLGKSVGGIELTPPNSLDLRFSSPLGMLVLPRYPYDAFQHFFPR